MLIPLVSNRIGGYSLLGVRRCHGALGGSLATTLAAATRLDSTVQVTVSKQL